MSATLRPEAARWTTVSSSATRPASGLVQALFLLAVLVLFTLSGGVLWYAGYNYDGLTGSGVTKIHPGTYLVFLAFAVAALQSGNPIGFVVSGFAQRPGSLLLFAAALVAFVQTLYRSGPGMAGLIDTYMLPGLVSVLFMRSGRRMRDRLEVVIHAALICNAVLGLVEFGTKHLYFPYRFDGAVFPSDTRSSALQGHPLGNATITAVYILALLGGGGRFSAPLRAGVIALEGMALVAFGGRSALVVVAALGTLAAVGGLHRTLRSGRVNLLGAAAAVLLVTAAPLAVVGLSAGGFFDALILRFTDDGGSANARVEMLTLIQQIPLRDLVIGPDQSLVDSLRRVNGLEEGIENPLVRTMVYQGLLLTILLAVAVGVYLREVAVVSGRGLFLAMIGFLVIINTFESLASKSTMLAKFAVLILILFRPERARPQVPIRAGGRSEREPDAMHPRQSSGI